MHSLNRREVFFHLHCDFEICINTVMLKKKNAHNFTLPFDSRRNGLLPPVAKVFVLASLAVELGRFMSIE